jgi:hypothetical protein
MIFSNLVVTLQRFQIKSATKELAVMPKIGKTSSLRSRVGLGG